MGLQRYIPAMLMSQKSLLSEARSSAHQAEHYARVLFKQLKEAEEHLQDLQHHIPEHAPKKTAESICKTMRKLEDHTKRIAKHAHHLSEHIEKLDEGAQSSHK